MADAATLALEATRRLRQSQGFRALGAAERDGLERDLRRIEGALARDPYARVLEDELPIPPGLLPGGGRSPAPAAQPAAPAAQPATSPPAQSEVDKIGRQAAEAVASLDFPGFVAGLLQGVFQAIVDATIQQVRAYAELVGNLSRSVDDFTRENVTPNQARDTLVQKHGEDLALVLPAPGAQGQPRVTVRRGREGTSPPWLADYGLDGEELTDELVEGALLEKARTRAGEERLQTLATMVLMGINRVVVNEGSIRAKLQFHAQAKEKTTAELYQGQQGAQTGIASRSSGAQAGATMLVSTMSANAQAEASIRADLMGEVHVTFRTETFNLDNFANTQAIQLIQRHARWQGPSPAAAPAPAVTTTTSPATRPPEGGNA